MAATTSSVPPGGCEVCDAPTTQRCVACLAHGLDLYSCSTDHQRLLWPAHRLVCGANSSPFMPPDLSSDQRNQLCSHTIDTGALFFPSLTLTPQKTRAKACWTAAFGGENKAKVKKGSKTARLIDSGMQSSEIKQAVLLHAWARLCDLDDHDPPLLSPALTPMHHAASLYMQIRALHLRPIDADVNNRLLHAILFLFQLASFETRSDRPPSSFSPEYLPTAARNVLDLLSPCMAGYSLRAVVDAVCALVNYVAPIAKLDLKCLGDVDGPGTSVLYFTRSPPREKAKKEDGGERARAPEKGV
ncbi:hypothetical protein JCM8208_003673 [Rhodotorula glutinis]